jgi:hypothetical protein
MRRCRLAVVLMVAVIVIVMLSAIWASADIPRKINYQGRLSDPVSGLPLTGTHDIEFRLYDVVSGGGALWSETQSVDTDSVGVFSAILGNQNPIAIAFDSPAWLEVVIDGEILAPRREIVSVPYAFHAANCDSLDGQSPISFALWDSLSVTGTINDAGNPIDWTRLKNVPAGFADGTDDGVGDGYSLDASDGSPIDAVYVDESGNVGVGTTDPQGPVHIYGGASGATPEGGSELVIEDDGNARINLLSPNDAYPGLIFGDPQDNSVGWMIYNHNSDKLRLGAGDADRITITGEGDVGIGTSVPSTELEVAGAIRATAPQSRAMAVVGKATATGDQGNYGGYFRAAGDSATAVYGEAPSAENKLHYGGYFKADGPFGRGVYGESSMEGTSFGTGGHFEGKGDYASGVWGRATATGDFMNEGGFFTAAGEQGRGVFAVAEAEVNNTNYGGYFYANGTEGRGVYGACQGSYGIGVRGASTGIFGTGVYGLATGSLGRGVVGEVQYNSSLAYAIMGQTGSNPNAYAGYFIGKVHVSGNLSKTGGEFLIDHPADPKHKVLRHSFVESPERLLIYKGRANLEGGAVTVELPSYFEALVHPDGREIVLTCVGGYSPLYLDGNIAGGRFTVRTGEGGSQNQEFSWVVYGTRNDAWAQQNPVVVEEDKTADGEFKVGEYLNPRAFGQVVEPIKAPAEELMPPELPTLSRVDEVGD